MARLREGFPLSNRLLREMHAILMSKGRGGDKEPGEFRRSQNWIGGTRPGNARFVPPPPPEVEPCMAALEAFLHEEAVGLPVLVKAALAHVQFETIHPFLDGNGRLGRLLIALLLHHGRLLAQPLLYLSLYLKSHRSVYYDLLDRVRTTGDWEAWVDFFLEGVETTAHGAVETARRLADLFEEDIRRTTAVGRSAASALRVLAALRERPVTTLAHLCNHAQMTFPTAGKAMQTLVAAGIARELTGQRRNRVFVYDSYLGILNEGGQPL
jgi:Fic family protein